jgi:hypothetical protein
LTRSFIAASDAELIDARISISPFYNAFIGPDPIVAALNLEGGNHDNQSGLSFQHQRRKSGNPYQ